ncbi:uncharacterized protein LOC117650638 [Thrips palmi]|uniref:Uncharacterized protein LOC117650638 n=1 Tax=Thrips palmi TaxID=161013 RepID=A0A6P8ZY84_THRPL|nr:uncharacterized protein LOC117650638 [Thrips palmi]
MHDAESRCSGQLAGLAGQGGDRGALVRPVAESGAGEPGRPTSLPKLEVAENQALVQRASSESLNTYVRRKACTIMHTVAKNMAWFERQDAARNAAGSRERLLQQVSRVAAYTAASRHLRHATSLYVVASIASRRARRGVGRYRKLDCPPRPVEPVPVEPPPRLAMKAHRLHSAAPPSTPPATPPSAPAVHINDLPKDLLLKILSELDQRELSLHVAPVCRAWHRLARSRQFWREITFDAAFHHYSAQSVCQLLRATPGLWTLELVACRDVDLILAQVCESCRKLRTLVLDSCNVSQRRQAAHLQVGAEGKESVLESVLEQCVCLQYLIVAFTPHLYTDGFFSLLGRRCWSMQCFLVSADDADVRKFCESLSAEDAECGGGAEALLVSLTGSWTRTVPPPVCPVTTASDNCHVAHPPSPREAAGLRRRVTAVHTRNRLLRVLALRPDPHRELRLLQWRLADSHATLDYFGVEARLCLQ